MRAFVGSERLVARLWLLLCLASIETPAQFHLSGGRLLLGDEPVVLRGAVYSNRPIGFARSSVLDASECLYGRDFPLIAALGANVVRTRALVRSDDAWFARSLADNGLYWLADFPLDPYFDPGRSLSPNDPAGGELRERILGDFAEYARRWADEPRLVGFVFGDRATEDYDRKFAGSPADFRALLGAAKQALRDAGLGDVLLTTNTADVADIGSVARGADDESSADPDFWSLDLSGEADIEAILRNAAERTTKPLLVSAFGIDAHDNAVSEEDEVEQAEAVARLASLLDAEAGKDEGRLLGALAAAFVDEWARGGPDPSLHGTGGRAAPGSPDGFWNAAWAGLFRLESGGLAGLDATSPRQAYFALAEAWGGSVPSEISLVGPPELDFATSSTEADRPVFGRGALVSLQGRGLAAESRAVARPSPLPASLGTAAACLGGRPVPLLLASPREIRGQIPWEVRGAADLVVFRAGAVSTPREVEIVEAAPEILDGAIFRPGLPCPVDELNGARSGDYLEIFSTGLGPPSEHPVSGVAPSAAIPATRPPKVRLNGVLIETLYSGMFPGAVGVHQTNVRVPEDFPPGRASLRLQADDAFSPPRSIAIVDAQQRPDFDLVRVAPAPILLQADGPRQTLFVRLDGRNSFCELIRFQLEGMPPGVQADIPLGFPGQTLPLTIWAERDAPRARQAAARLLALSTLDSPRAVGLDVTVIPGQGDLVFEASSGGWLSGEPSAEFQADDLRIFRAEGGGPGRGFNFMTLDPETGAPGPFRTFDTWADDAASDAMERFLRALPRGTVVFAAIADDGFLMLSDSAKEALGTLLASRRIDELAYQHSWAIASRVGAEAPFAEDLADFRRAVARTSLKFPLE